MLLLLFAFVDISACVAILVSCLRLWDRAFSADRGARRAQWLDRKGGCRRMHDVHAVRNGWAAKGVAAGCTPCTPCAMAGLPPDNGFADLAAFWAVSHLCFGFVETAVLRPPAASSIALLK
jgi:hypothetical protein